MTTKHNLPPVEGTCLCCWDDISASNYVEYRSAVDGAWLPSGYCQACIEQLISTQWSTYTNSLEKTTCKAEMRRLLQRGPPINIRDPKALPCPEDAEVHSLWFAHDGFEHSAKLVGSLEGVERDKYWQDKMSFYDNDEPEES